MDAIKNSRYVDIAIDLANKIKRRDYKEGDKLRGRSLSASDYNVSSETIRKSFNLLEQHHIISVKEKSGAIILSRDCAIKFLNQMKKKNQLKDYYSLLDDLLMQRHKLELDITQTVKHIQSYLANEKIEVPIDYFSVQLHENYWLIGKTIGELDIYKETGATLFGVQSENTVLSSPPLDYLLKVNDKLYFSGDNDVAAKTISYLKH